jgi:hypothetical protein
LENLIQSTDGSTCFFNSKKSFAVSLGMQTRFSAPEEGFCKGLCYLFVLGAGLGLFRFGQGLPRLG